MHACWQQVMQVWVRRGDDFSDLKRCRFTFHGTHPKIKQRVTPCARQQVHQQSACSSVSCARRKPITHHKVLYTHNTHPAALFGKHPLQSTALILSHHTPHHAPTMRIKQKATALDHTTPPQVASSNPPIRHSLPLPPVHRRPGHPLQADAVRSRRVRQCHQHQHRLLSILTLCLRPQAVLLQHAASRTVQAAVRAR
jgi:hypothetical protein